MTESEQSIYEPGLWLVVFHRRTGNKWLDRIVPGEFKHVSAIAWVERSKCWLFYDVGRQRTMIKVLPEKAGLEHAARVMAGNEVLQVPAKQGRPIALRFGFWCVPAVKHLVGSASGALLPGKLWRDLMAENATQVPNGRCPIAAPAVA